MRAAQIKGGVVVNFAEVAGFNDEFVDPQDAVIGSVVDGGTFTAPMPTVADYVTAVQAKLDAKAQEHHYDGILSACSYAASTNPRFQPEGQACVAWRDDVWAACYAILAQVQAGQIAQPSVAGLLAMLPEVVWPA